MLIKKGILLENFDSLKKGEEVELVIVGNTYIINFGNYKSSASLYLNKDDIEYIKNIILPT